MLENEHTLLLFEEGGGKEQPASKTSAYARFRRRREVGHKELPASKRAYALVSRKEGGGGGGKEQPLSKTSAYAHFQGEQVVGINLILFARRIYI